MNGDVRQSRRPSSGRPTATSAGPPLLAAAEAGLTTVLWSAQAREDLVASRPDGIVDDIASQVRPGSIVLAHDTGSDDRLITIDRLRARSSAGSATTATPSPRSPTCWRRAAPARRRRATGRPATGRGARGRRPTVGSPRRSTERGGRRERQDADDETRHGDAARHGARPPQRLGGGEDGERLEDEDGQRRDDVPARAAGRRARARRRRPRAPRRPRASTASRSPRRRRRAAAAAARRPLPAAGRRRRTPRSSPRARASRRRRATPRGRARRSASRAR